MSEQALRTYLKGYTTRDDRLAALSFGLSFLAFHGLLTAAILAWPRPLLTAPLIVITAFAAGRLYVLQHDLGHHSMFTSRRWNEIAGYLASTFTLTPFHVMKVNHDRHHGYLGNLEHRETTEIHTMTLREWEAADWRKRLGYRLYRNPLLMTFFGGAWTYIFRYRWPKNTMEIGPAGVIVHDALVVTWVVALWAVFGWAGPLTLLTTTLTAGVFGVFMVYLQHNFEDTYWDRKPDLDFRRATLHGSSALDLGWLWDLGTGNIAYHNLHHYMPSIPSYRLRKAFHNLPPELAKDLPGIGWRQALASFRLKLWDEEAERLVPFPRSTAARTAALSHA